MHFDDHTLNILDFPHIRSALAERCATQYGIERALSVRPTSDSALIANELDQIEDALFGVSLHLGGVVDVRDAVKRAREGKVLSGSDILEVAYTLDAAATLRRSIAEHSRGPLRHLVESMGQHAAIVRVILEKFDRDGQLRDDASPKLRQLRRRIQPLKNEIREKLTHIMERWGDMLQEHLITQRRDRFVVPIKASFVNQVQGIVLDVSSTGQTYFVEPAAIVGLGNELSKTLLEEEAEVRRILLEISGMVALEPDLDQTFSVIAELDLTAAKALLAREWKLCRPTQTHDFSFRIVQARHPLIAQAVPNDLELDEKTRLLLITGPNMGGKTVTLKTLGLIALMFGCGMYVPAYSAELPIIGDILVDVGDDQSIEANLSTFAAHLQHLNTILKHASPNTLLLIDELGSGTDPGEGAALAQSILLELLSKRARGVVTSHLAPLKQFALETPGLLNASMGFDVEQLMPTYQLLRGQPGRSYALAIAERLGLPSSVIAQAKAILGPEEGRLEVLLEHLEQAYVRTQDELQNSQQMRMEAERELAELNLARQNIGNERNQILREASERVDQIYREAYDQVRQMKVRIRSDELARPKILEELKALRHVAQAERSALSPRIEIEDVRVGSLVDVPAYGTVGQVLDVRGDELVVQLGVLKINVRRRDVRLKREAPTKVQSFAGAVTSFQREVNLRGKHVEEAVEHVRAFVGEAFALKESPLRVVHGKGQGVLRRLIRDYLKTDKRVESFHDAEPYQGGHGVTVIHIKT
ncbi:MAG: endonuclease MutS2 [Deinococcaceae bacterium]